MNLGSQSVGKLNLQKIAQVKMIRTNMVKLYRDGAKAARKECGISMPEDAGYFSIIKEYKEWRLIHKQRGIVHRSAASAVGNGSEEKQADPEAQSADGEDDDPYSEEDINLESEVEDTFDSGFNNGICSAYKDDVIILNFKAQESKVTFALKKVQYFQPRIIVLGRILQLVQ